MIGRGAWNTAESGGTAPSRDAAVTCFNSMSRPQLAYRQSVPQGCKAADQGVLIGRARGFAGAG